MFTPEDFRAVDMMRRKLVLANSYLYYTNECVKNAGLLESINNDNPDNGFMDDEIDRLLMIGYSYFEGAAWLYFNKEVTTEDYQEYIQGLRKEVEERASAEEFIKNLANVDTIEDLLNSDTDGEQ